MFDQDYRKLTEDQIEAKKERAKNCSLTVVVLTER
jgi:hypothetical protein